MSTASAPMEIGRVRLIVRDLTRVADFYATALGLEKLSADASQVTLGAGNRALVELTADKAARVRSPREAGLFHTAFLLPKRADLGAWVHHASESRLPVQGASDHKVSEAIYFADPEGNGIEKGRKRHGAKAEASPTEERTTRELLRGIKHEIQPSVVLASADTIQRLVWTEVHTPNEGALHPYIRARSRQ